MRQKSITLAMGNGGEENRDLIEKLLFKHLGNEILKKAEDASTLEIKNKIALTTDSFTISPIFFEGGDIGKLSICGTCNDLAMVGAKPKYLTLSLIIEEGFNYRDLEKIVRSIKKELKENDGAIVVTGDTKVVSKGSVDKIFINTTGVGEVLVDGISASNLEVGDQIIVSGDIGRHGASIFAIREGIELESKIKSDCASLWKIVKALFDAKIKPKAMRDATRGGVAAVLNEWAKSSSVGIEIEEDLIPVSDEVKGICEILGFEPTALANEGRFLLAVDKKDSQKTLEILRNFEEAKEANIIGEVSSNYKEKVILKSSWGTKRFLDLPTGELLPRIC
jgi:hydrogenase expression/formation protein HypE